MEIIQYKTHYEIGKTHWWTNSTQQLICDFVKRFVPEGSSILDAGCGVGKTLLLLKGNYSCYGLDFSREALDYCKLSGLNCPLVQGNVEKLPFPSKTFKGVLSIDVLYHQAVHDDRVALTEMARVLVPGGWLFLHLPAYQWMTSSHDRYAYTARRYTSKQVHSLLASSGFDIVRLAYRVSILFPLAVLQRKILKRRKKSNFHSLPGRLNTSLKKIMAMENYWLLKHNLPFGLSVMAIAKKGR